MKSVRTLWLASVGLDQTLITEYVSNLFRLGRSMSDFYAQALFSRQRPSVMLVQSGAALCIGSLGAGKYKRYNPVTALSNHTPKFQILSVGKLKS